MAAAITVAELKNSIADGGKNPGSGSSKEVSWDGRMPTDPRLTQCIYICQSSRPLIEL